jgi:hypothetical protein
MDERHFWNSISGELTLWLLAVAVALAVTFFVTVGAEAWVTAVVFSTTLFVALVALSRVFGTRTFY